MQRYGLAPDEVFSEVRFGRIFAIHYSIATLFVVLVLRVFTKGLLRLLHSTGGLTVAAWQVLI